jgi:signal transduction histidine kinase
MSALELIRLVNQVLFIGLFAVVLWHAVRRPTRAALNTAILFGSIAAVVASSFVLEAIGAAGAPWSVGVTLLLLNAAPFAMLRLVDDFSGTPGWVQLAGAAAFVAVAALGFVTAPDTEVVSIASIGLFIAVGGYAAAAFTAESRRTSGLTRRRMSAVAAGAFLFIAAVIGVFLAVLSPGLAEASAFGVQLLALGAVLAFFLGFAPPTWIRRAWREPDLRGFLERSIHLAAVADERAALREMEAAAAAAFGATGAAIGLADADRSTLRYPVDDGWAEYPADRFVAGRAFSQQRRVVAIDAVAEDPENAASYRDSRATTVIAAPISTEDRRLGVLTIYADRAPIFVEDDLWLLELLADQSAVLLEARTLAAHASELRAREEATQLQEEFLSTAAHDLRTPLTVVLAQAELLERRLDRDPSGVADPAGIRRIAKEARRLRDLVSDLLDAQRLQQARAVMELRPLDLREVVALVRDRSVEHGVPVSAVIPEGPVRANVDAPRLEQVVENLVDNAVKYGRQGEAPLIALAADGEQAVISVVDHGIGIPTAERHRIFERFFRASNAHGVTDTGIGLGLYICRRIVEEHGGTIAFSPTDGGGSTFRVSLPLLAHATDEPDATPSPTPEDRSTLPLPASELAADA